MVRMGKNYWLISEDAVARQDEKDEECRLQSQNEIYTIAMSIDENCMGSEVDTEDPNVTWV